MELNEIKTNVAANLSKLRTAAGMTQAQLAEKLNYTDKAVSKWERAESVPDISVLKQIADMFSVTIDWLIADHGKELPSRDHDLVRVRRHNKLQVTLLSVAAVWFVACIAFVVLLCLKTPRPWLSFLWAIPLTCIDVLVFNAVWGKYKRNFLFISLLIWTLPAAVYITIAHWDLWFIFIVSVPLQVATVFWSQIRLVISPKGKQK